MFWCLFTSYQHHNVCRFRVSQERRLSQRRQLSYSTGKNQFISENHNNASACTSVCVCLYERGNNKERGESVHVMQSGFLWVSTLVASIWSCRESMKRSPTGSQASLTPSACSRATASSSIAAWIWSRRSKVLSMCLWRSCLKYNSLQLTNEPLKIGANASNRPKKKKEKHKSTEHAFKDNLFKCLFFEDTF